MTGMEADDEGGGANLELLAKKLQHPLLKIRARALQSLLFKLRERLVRVTQLEPLQRVLTPALLAALAEPTLEPNALHALELLARSGSSVLLASLQHHAAAEHLQRAAVGKRPELRTAYEKLLQQIYVTSAPTLRSSESASVDNGFGASASSGPAADDATAGDNALGSSRARSDTCSRQPPVVAELEARGWRFAHVTLAAVDDQQLFEFEVKLRLRTTTDAVVAMCATFRNDLLRNFPAEVFLQRPAVLQHLLRLVQQPLLPGSPATAGVMDLERAMEVSLGVNYFDELLSPTFSPKRGNLAGATVMASVKALESLLNALRLSRRTSLDPVNVVHEPQISVELFDSYDTRRTLYPRAMVEIKDTLGNKGADGHTTVSVEHLQEQFSLGGATYSVFLSLLPLLRSARHPRLHLLNLLSVALSDLPEKGGASGAEARVQELDKLRLERIFEVLSGICRPPADKTSTSLMDEELELTPSTQWKVVELVIQLLQLFPSSCYRVDRAAHQGIDVESNLPVEEQNGVIVVPRRLWEAVKLWVSNPAFPEVSAREWGKDALPQCLSEIDATVPAFIQLKRSSQEDAELVQAFVAFARANREQLEDLGPWEKPSILDLSVAQKAVQTRGAFDSTDAECIADATLQVFWTVLTAQDGAGGRVSEKDIAMMQSIVRDLVVGVSEQKSSGYLHAAMVGHFFRGLVELVDEHGKQSARLPSVRRLQFVNEVVCESRCLATLLSVLAAQAERVDSEPDVDSFWGLLQLALDAFTHASAEELAALAPVVPLLQHFAYVEPSEKSCPLQRSTQPQLAEVLNRVEKVMPDSERVLLIARCLLHQSSYIRNAAASGIRQLLSRVVPSSVDCMAESEEVLEDPLGCSSAEKGEASALESRLLETPLPSIHHRESDYTPSENELSSQLNKLTHLRKVLSGTSSAFKSMKEVACKELVILVESATPGLFALLEEVGEIAKLVDLLRQLLPAEFNADTTGQGDELVVCQALLLLRTLLLRSRLLRRAIQHDGEFVVLLLPLAFHPRAWIRAQMYYILLLLTCSVENFSPNQASAATTASSNSGNDEAIIPVMIKRTFGLHSSRWERCFVPECTIEQQLQIDSSCLGERVDSAWVSEVQTIINKASSESECAGGSNEQQTEGKSQPLAISTEYAFLTQKLHTASSHGKFLNALYHLLMVCEAWPSARTRFVGDWEAAFERYFTVPPKGERDEVIVSSIICALSVVFNSMSRGEQVRALVVVKRKVLPLLKKSQSKAFSLQVARLLLTMSVSKVSDLFLSLAADTDIIASICNKYSSVYATEPVLHAMMLEVLQRFALGMNEQAEMHLSSPSREKICKRLLEMLSSLLTVVCRHRMPGSFLERDAFAAASQCMISILQALPRDVLLASDSPLQHTDSAILLDGSWASRFLFDHVSPIRELGFVVIQLHASADTPSRLLEMAVETSTDESECDAVRAEACNVLVMELLSYSERPPDRQASLADMLHGGRFAGKALSSFSTALKGNKLLIRSGRSFARLVRVLYTQKSTLAPHFGDMSEHLAAAEEEYDIYPLLVQALSLREWRDKCDRYCSCCMLLPRCDAEAWRRSLLPAIVELLIEILRLLQAIFRDGGYSQVAFFLMHTTLQYQLVELVCDVYASLSSLDPFNDSYSRATRRSHYEVLELCAGTLSTLLVQAFQQRQRERNSEQPGVSTHSKLDGQLIAVVSKLMATTHPIDFRISFSRLVPTFSLLKPDLLSPSDTPAANALCSVVFDLYREIAEFRPLEEPHSASAKSNDRVFPLSSIRRVSYALRVLLESNPVLRQLFLMKHGLSFTMSGIKDSFAAIRMSGGFGSKKVRGANASTSPQDTYALDLCARIQVHIEVVSSVIGGDKQSQQLVKNEGLPTVLLSNWNVMKMAHVRGSSLLLSALRLLANYTHGSGAAKSSLLAPVPPASSKAQGGDRAPTLLSLLFNLASNCGDVAPGHRRLPGARDTGVDLSLSNTACQVLQSVLLDAECVLAAVKAGWIVELVDVAQERLEQATQTSKTDRLDAENLAYVLDVLSSVACSEEGARVLYSNCATALPQMLDDAMHSSEPTVQRSGCLLLRNLALSKTAKSHFAVWEAVLDAVVVTCVRENEMEQGGSLAVLRCLSAALWAFVYDNQKARALLLSKATAVRDLQRILDSRRTGSQYSQQSVQVPSESTAASLEVVENLQRVLTLVQE